MCLALLLLVERARAADEPKIVVEAGANEIFSGESVDYVVEIRNAKDPAPPDMRALLVTNDLVLISYVEALLAGQGIEAVVFDGNMSLMEGSIGAFPRRLVVEESAWVQASHILDDAGPSPLPKRVSIWILERLHLGPGRG